MGNMTWGLPTDLSNYIIEKNSDYLKLIVASYFRFRRNCDVVCQEFEMSPKNRADVIVVKDNMLIEVECKTSKADLKNEFLSATKQKKHFNFESECARHSEIFPSSKSASDAKFIPPPCFFIFIDVKKTVSLKDISSDSSKITFKFSFFN